MKRLLIVCPKASMFAVFSISEDTLSMIHFLQLCGVGVGKRMFIIESATSSESVPI